MKFGILNGVNITQKTEWGIEGLPNLTSYLALEKSVGNLQMAVYDSLHDFSYR